MSVRNAYCLLAFLWLWCGLALDLGDVYHRPFAVDLKTELAASKSRAAAIWMSNRPHFLKFYELPIVLMSELTRYAPVMRLDRLYRSVSK